MTEMERIKSAVKLAFRYGQIDGAHHRLWVIDQMVRVLSGDNYDEFVDEYNKMSDEEYTYHWETGIAP